MEEEVLHPPQMRLKMCNQVSEYIYLLKVVDTEAFVPVLEADKFIFYYCILAGPYNLIFMSYKPIDLSHLEGFKRIVASGVRSNFYVPPVHTQSYRTAYQKILEKCNKKIEYSMFDINLEDFKWTKKLWKLFCDLKYDLRVDFTPLVKKHEFTLSTFYERVNQLLTYCDIYVPLYPSGEPKYTFFYFLIKTNHQKFIADSFGELPVFSSHLRIKDYLLSYVPVLHEEERDFFRNTLSVWQRRGIIKSYDLSIALWSEGTIHPGMPCPPPPPPPSGSIPPDKEEEIVGKVYKSFM